MTLSIDDSSRHVLTAEDARLFAAALNRPSALTPHALRAAASYQHRVANADARPAEVENFKLGEA